jgi:hypothetical protein
MAELRIAWGPSHPDASFTGDSFDELEGPLGTEPPHPINWNLLTAEEAEVEWIELNRWVNWHSRQPPQPSRLLFCDHDRTFAFRCDR